jgi:hypothetical protein
VVKIGGANRYRLDRIEEYVASRHDDPVSLPSLSTDRVSRGISRRRSVRSLPLAFSPDVPRAT